MRHEGIRFGACRIRVQFFGYRWPGGPGGRISLCFVVLLALLYA